MWREAQVNYRPIIGADVRTAIVGIAHKCGLIACKLGDGWHIIHHGSGYDLGMHIVQPSKVRAKHAIKMLVGVCDWHKAREAFSLNEANAVAARLKETGLWKD